MADRAYLERLTKELTDKGLLIEAGYAAFRLYCIPLHASKDQLEDMRIAFFAGAQHLYGSIMTVLDPGDEPSDADLNRMRVIHDELEVFRKDLEQRMPTEGSA